MVNYYSDEHKALTGAQLRAARAILGISAAELATRTKLGVATIRRAELVDGPVVMTNANADRIVSYLVAENVTLIVSDGGGVGVCFVKAAG